MNCNAVDQRGLTPLLVAAVQGHVDVLDVLFHCGAVDLFACRAFCNDLLALVRRAYARAEETDRPKFRACLRLITKALSLLLCCVVSLRRLTVWLFETSACSFSAAACTGLLVPERSVLGSGPNGEAFHASSGGRWSDAMDCSQEFPASSHCKSNNLSVRALSSIGWDDCRTQVRRRFSVHRGIGTLIRPAAARK